MGFIFLNLWMLVIVPGVQHMYVQCLNFVDKNFCGSMIFADLEKPRALNPTKIEVRRYSIAHMCMHTTVVCICGNAEDSPHPLCHSPAAAVLCHTPVNNLLHTCSDSFTLARVQNNLRCFGSFQLPSSVKCKLRKKVAESCRNV